MTQITIKPTTGFTTPPPDMAFTATIREIKGGGISGKSNYGATAEMAKANLIARLESEGHQFEDIDGNPVTQYVQPDGMLSDKRYGDENCCGECFVTSHDVPRGDFSMVAVPEGCGDEECECHEYEPNFNGFISTVSGKEIATISLVVLMIATIWIAT